MRRTSLMVVPIALLLAGCGLGEGAPHPGVAASVNGAELSLSALDHLVDAVCVANAHDPQGQPVPRAGVEQDQVRGWVRNKALITYAAAHEIAVPSSERDLSTLVPGWSDMTADEQAALQEYATESVEADAIAKDPGTAGAQAGDFHIVINPRFGLAPGDTGLSGVDTDLSVPVSAEAKGQSVVGLPPGQVCG
ncbi:hypothetical protein [Nocardioides montaniterrae]